MVKNWKYWFNYRIIDQWEKDGFGFTWFVDVGRVNKYIDHATGNQTHISPVGWVVKNIEIHGNNDQ